MRLRRLWIFLAALLALGALPTSAQTITTVTGQVVDPNGIPYAGARLVVMLNNPGPGSPTLTPCSSSPCPVPLPGPITLDDQGNIPGGGIQLYANASILPAGTTYSFQVNQNPGVLIPWGTGAQLFTLPNVTIAGSSQNLTTNFAAVPPPVLTLIGSASGGGGKPAADDGLYYVATEGSDTNDCRSWSTACLTVEGAETKLAAGTAGNPTPGGSILVGSGTFSGAATFTVATKLYCNGHGLPTLLTIPAATNTSVVIISGTASNSRITECAIDGNMGAQTAGSGVEVDGDASNVEIDHDTITDSFTAGISVPAGSSTLSIHDNAIAGNGQGNATSAQIVYVEPAHQDDVSIAVRNNSLDGSTPNNGCIRFFATSAAATPITQILQPQIEENTCLTGVSAAYNIAGFTLIADVTAGASEEIAQTQVTGNIINANSGSVPSSPPAIAQSQLNSLISSWSFTANHAVSVGDEMFMWIVIANSGTAAVNTDSLGNTWTRVTNGTIGGGSTDNVELWESAVTHAGTPTFTGNVGAANDGDALFFDVTGLGAEDVRDAVQAGTAASFTSGPITTTAANDWVLSCAGNDGTATLASSAAGFAKIGTSAPDLACYWANVTGTGSQSVAWTVTPSGNFATAMESFAPASGGGTPLTYGIYTSGPLQNANIANNQVSLAVADCMAILNGSTPLTTGFAYQITGNNCDTGGPLELAGNGILTATVTGNSFTDPSGAEAIFVHALGGGVLEQVNVNGNTIEATNGTAAGTTGIDFALEVNNSAIIGNHIYGEDAGTAAAISLTSSSNNLVDSNVLVDYQGTGAGAIGVDITNSASTANCVGINLFSSITTPISDSGTSTGCPNSSGGGGGGLATFSSKNLASPVSIPANTLTPIDTLTITMPPSGGPFRAIVSETYFNDGGVDAQCSVSDGTNNWNLWEQATVNNITNCIGSQWSPGTYANGAVITFTVNEFNTGAATVETVGNLNGSVPSSIQVAVFGTSSGGGGGAGPVTTVFGRTGNVSAVSGDYSVGQVTGAAPLASPALTGTPTAPTPASTSNNTTVPTTAFVQGLLSAAGPAPNQSVFYLSPNCGAQANCFPVNANTHFVCDASFTNTSQTVTVPGGNFTSADVGKIVFGTSPGGGPGNCGGGLESGVSQTLVVPQGTITTINSATSIQVSVAATANCNGGSVACILVWGPDDSSNLTAWANAVTAACGTGVMPAGIMLTQNAIGVSNPNSCGSTVFSNRVGATFAGVSPGATMIIPTPNFSFTGCTGTVASCFFSPGPGTYLFNFIIWGAAQSLTGAAHSNQLINLAGNSFAQNVVVSDYGSGSTNLIGIEVTGSGYTWLYFVQDDGAGNTACAINAQNIYFNGVVCDDVQNFALTILGSGDTLFSWGGLYGNVAGATSIISVPANATFNSNSDSFYGPSVASQIVLSVTGTANLNNALMFQGTSPTSSVGAKVLSGGKLKLGQSLLQNAAVGLQVAAGGSYFDDCGNSISGTAAFSVAGNVFGSCSITGTNVAAGNLVLSANFGSGAAVSAPLGANSPISFTITNGASGTGAAPTVTYTFPKPYAAAPLFCTATQVGGTNATGTFSAGTPSATSVVFTYSLTPTASDTELVQVVCYTQ